MVEVAGLDEAGRGALAGPVVAAAVILGAAHGIQGLNDSKQLSAGRREALAQQIRDKAVAWAVAEVDHAGIDEMNILRASLHAMSLSVERLSVRPGLCLVDGNQQPKLAVASRTVIGGDAIHPEIMAASILAKVHRDAKMLALDSEFPAYGFAANKGYPTAAHRAALIAHGPCAVHRLSYAPVARLLQAQVAT